MYGPSGDTTARADRYRSTGSDALVRGRVRPGHGRPLPLTPRWSCTGVHRIGLSAICQHPSLAKPCVAGHRLDLSVPTTWDDVLRSTVLKSSVWGSHSLHTAEVTGSIPVTPTTHFCRSTPSHALHSSVVGVRPSSLGHTWGMLRAQLPCMGGFHKPLRPDREGPVGRAAG